MIRLLTTFARFLRLFRRNERGSSTLEFMFVFPFFMLMFTNCYEAGMLSLRHAMLERGLDLTVRAVRIGKIPDPSHAQLKEAICERAMLIPDCDSDLQLEMIREDIRNWAGLMDGPTQCIDRALDVQPAVQFTNGGNNELMMLQVCVLYDPKMLDVGIGQKLRHKNDRAYALVATSAFVMEPYK